MCITFTTLHYILKKTIPFVPFSPKPPKRSWLRIVGRGSIQNHHPPHSKDDDVYDDDDDNDNDDDNDDDNDVDN